MDQSPGPSGTKPRLSKKTKLYLLDVQEDPEMEKKRQRAVKAFKNRQKNDKEVGELEEKLNSLGQEVQDLKDEKYKTERAVSQLEGYFRHSNPHQVPNPSSWIPGDTEAYSASVSLGSPRVSSYSPDLQRAEHPTFLEMDQSPGPSGTKPRLSKKTKLYLLDVQKNPEMEKKRLRAVKAFKNRQKKDKEVDELEGKLYGLEQEVQDLKDEKYKTELAVSQLEGYFHHGSPHQGQSADGSYNFANEYSPY
ncbi:uncharacterized protein [Macrobrachium rosenbergii]|uniref:uncharacterized protein n=1 Tax=Macrobrachium rosenbergii TaxID=79674 RepID=UPI0034D6B549